MAFYHQRKIKSKGQNLLFSPAIFDPTKFEGKDRGNENIVYLRNIIMDFDGGKLEPKELPDLFPGLRIVVMNIYHHLSDQPRFRVVIPTTEKMIPKVYKLVYRSLADKLIEAGHQAEFR